MVITADEFKRWQSNMKISAAEAARRLGIHPNTVARYRDKGGPMMLRLACLALFHDLEEDAFE